MNSISVKKFKDYKYLVYCERVCNKNHDTRVVVFGYNTINGARRCKNRLLRYSDTVNVYIE